MLARLRVSMAVGRRLDSPLETTMPDKKPTLRSAQWFGTADKNGFMYRSWMKNQGIADHQFHGKPIICNTWSAVTPSATAS